LPALDNSHVDSRPLGPIFAFGIGPNVQIWKRKCNEIG
jgi:hypothetical protein